MSITNDITKKLKNAFDPFALEIINESHLHKGHRGNPGGTETHFHICIGSNDFTNKSLVQIHRLIYKCLDTELKNGVHALKITRLNSPTTFV